MKNLFITTMAIAALAVPFAASAATYQYVNVNGNVAAVSADNPVQAMGASDISPSSGVMLAAGETTMTGLVPASSGPLYIFTYVDTAGYRSEVVAQNAAQAQAVSDIMPGSGVQQVSF